MLGRLLQAEQVRRWIRGGRSGIDTARLVPSLDLIIYKLINRLEEQSLLEEMSRAAQSRAEHQARLEARPHGMEEARPNDQWDATYGESPSSFRGVLRSMALFVLHGVVGRSEFESSDPNDFDPNRSLITPTWIESYQRDLKRAIINQCFTPSASSVITVSAPQMLLSTSLCSLLIGFGVYFGFLWTRSLDQTAGLDDSRNVFITYITGLIVSGLVYSISQLFQDDDKRNERAIMEDYLKEYVENNPEIVRNWGVYAEIVEGVLYFHSVEAESSRGTTSKTEQNPQGNGSLDSTGIELEDLPAVERHITI